MGEGVDNKHYPLREKQKTAKGATKAVGVR